MGACALQRIAVLAAAAVSIGQARAVSCPDLGDPSAVRAWCEGFKRDLWAEPVPDDENQLTKAVPEQMARLRACFPRADQRPAGLELLGKLYGPLAPPSLDGPLAGMSKLPEDFAIPGKPGQYALPRTRDEWDRLIAAKRGSWKLVSYKSKGEGGFQPPHNSLALLYIPGAAASPPAAFDRWIQFNWKTAPAETNALPVLPQGTEILNQKMQMIAVLPAGEGRRAQVRMLHWEDRGGYLAAPMIKEYPGHRTPPKVAACVSCHSNGLRSISPLGMNTREGEARMPDAAREAIESLQKIMEGYGPPDLEPVVASSREGEPLPISVQDLAGPPLGSENPPRPRTEEFIRGCASAQKEFESVSIYEPLKRTFTMSAEPKLRYSRIAQAMACATCHQPSRGRGVLSSIYHSDAIIFKVLGDRTMPAHMPGDALTDDERIALLSCLFEERRVAEEEWFKGLSCEPPAAPTADSAACVGGGEVGWFQQASAALGGSPVPKVCGPATDRVQSGRTRKTPPRPGTGTSVRSAPAD